MGLGTQRTGRESSYPSGGYPLGCRANVAVLQSPDLGHEKYDSEMNEAEKAGRESAHRRLPRLADQPQWGQVNRPADSASERWRLSRKVVDTADFYASRAHATSVSQGRARRISGDATKARAAAEGQGSAGTPSTAPVPR
jgi:hypothetical protein